MFNDTSYEIAFDMCIEYMVRMIEKYADSIDINETENIKCAIVPIYPADNAESGAVVCKRKSISTEGKEE